jgi:hypothetical protein
MRSSSCSHSWARSHQLCLAHLFDNFIGNGDQRRRDFDVAFASLPELRAGALVIERRYLPWSKHAARSTEAASLVCSYKSSLTTGHALKTITIQTMIPMIYRTVISGIQNRPAVAMATKLVPE